MWGRGGGGEGEKNSKKVIQLAAGARSINVFDLFVFVCLFFSIILFRFFSLWVGGRGALLEEMCTKWLG